MGLAEARREVSRLLGAVEREAVDALLRAYEAERTEDAITSSEPHVARQKVLAARELRALLKAPRGEGGQA